MIQTTADLLATIVAGTRRIVEVREQREPRAALEGRALTRRPRAGQLTAALSRTDRVNVIAECKRRSPSRGVLRASYDPAAIAAGYAAAGAAAISVLTEPTFFDGALEHLEAVRAAVGVPLLRKDFIVSEYQLLEARAAGADAVLLIVAALDIARLSELHGLAAALELEVLVEAHDAVAALRSSARFLGLGLAAIINIVNPDCIYLSGEITTAWDLIEGVVSKAVAERTLTEKAARTPLRVTSTQDYPRLKGAAALIAAPTFAAPRVA